MTPHRSERPQPADGRPPADVDPRTPAGVSADVADWMRCLIDTSVAGMSRAAMIDEMAALESVKNAASARQARLAVVFDVAERKAQAAAGVPARRQGRGVAEQIALARRESPTRGASFLAYATTLCLDMPATMTQFVAGELSEYRAALIATEVALLDSGGRAEVDAALHPGGAGGADITAMSSRQLRAAAAAAAYRVDPSLPVRRGKHAESERYVSLRPAPDTMTILSAYLPVRQGVACYAALRREADAARAAGDPRTRGQVMADALFARLTGAEHPGQVPLELQVVMTGEALFADASGEGGADQASGSETGCAPTTDSERPSGGAAGQVRDDEVTFGSSCADAPDADPPNTDPHATDVSGADLPDSDPLKAGASRVDAAAADPIDTDAPDTDPRSVSALKAVVPKPDVPKPDAPNPRERSRLGAAVREPGHVVGYGPVPSETIRTWPRESLDANGNVWIRRLLMEPITAQATAIDHRGRLFPPAVRRLILARDRYCRTPFCGAPIRHLDHARDHASGGATDESNGQGLCERCNQAKTSPGWSARAVPDPLGLGRRIVETTTPTGHIYRSTAPPLTAARPTARQRNDAAIARDAEVDDGRSDHVADAMPQAG